MSQYGMDDFLKLSKIISLYHPPDTNGHALTSPPDQTPGLIIICSWFAAATKHVAKYTTGYRQVFPNASILLIQTSLLETLFGSDLTPACEFLESYMKGDPNTRKPIVLHMFSNGGANTATWLAARLRKADGRLSFDTLVLDSCPGAKDIVAITRAMSFSLPNQYLLRPIGFYVMFAAGLVYKLFNDVTGHEDPITRIRRDFNDTSIFSKDTPRLYLYSEKDIFVKFQDVRHHAEDARAKGYTTVHEEVFLKAPHCALVNEDEARYWNAVREHIASSIRKA
ncbi:hypothetical protein LTR37_004919 [Vermiconidia calcicola]|uniref:Uncharacterized protein n=1 Tax=Vermiconidia calcicola TaxID=1690605 RepID=A0ACC3NKL3_9PEZI|nr:hypothetical protein LTR37_004919 [Vermiconidia calcicola]